MTLNKLEIDFLKELTTICVGSVANRMAMIVPFPVMITLPTVNMVSNDEEYAIFSSSNHYKYSLLIKGEGDFSAYIFISLSKRTPDIIIEHNPYMSEYADNNDPSFMESMVLETGNILSSAYMTAIEQFTGFCLIPTVPSFINKQMNVEPYLNIFSSFDLSQQVVIMQADLLLTAQRERALFATIMSIEEVQRILEIREERLL